MTATRLRPSAKPAPLIVLIAAALVCTACGGSSPASTNAAHATRIANAAVKTPRARVATRRHDKITSGTVIHHPFDGTGGGQINDDNPGRADTGLHPSHVGEDPCSLVSKQQAQAIVGGPVATPVDAPLGPTCIYRPAGSERLVTLSVQPLDLARIEPHVHDRRWTSVGGHAAFCGAYGQPTTFVALSDGRILTVTAPCALGLRFAADAVAHLRA